MDNNGIAIDDHPLPPSDSQPANETSKDRRLSTLNSYKLVFPFNTPPTLEAAASRVITNLGHYKIHYILFVWSTLFVALLPERKVSLILLLGTTNVAFVYLLLPRLFPKSVVLHQTIDKRLVLFFMAAVTMVEMILTRAAVHFFVTLVGATPVILAHALLRVRYSLFVREESCVREGLVPVLYFVPFEHEKIGKYDPLGSV